MRMFFFLTTAFFVMVSTADEVNLNRSVQWGYKVNYPTSLKMDQLRSLRKQLRQAGVEVLYPPEKEWKLVTGYLSVSTYLDEAQIKSLSELITSVESAQKTQRFTIQLEPGVTERDIQKLVVSFNHNKIQILSASPVKIPKSFLVKTALSAMQIKTIEEIKSYIKTIEERK